MADQSKRAGSVTRGQRIQELQNALALEAQHDQQPPPPKPSPFLKTGNTNQLVRHAILGEEQLRVYMRNLKSELSFAAARTSKVSLQSASDHDLVSSEQLRDLEEAQKTNTETMKQLHELEDMFESEHNIVLASINRILAQLNYPHALRTISELAERKDDILAGMKKELEIEIMQSKPMTAPKKVESALDEFPTADEENNVEDNDEAVVQSVPSVMTNMTNYEELCESALKISHDNFSTLSMSSRENNNLAVPPASTPPQARQVTTNDNSTMTHPATTPATSTSRPQTPMGCSFTVDIKDPKTGKRVHSFQSPAPSPSPYGATAGGNAPGATDDDINMTAFTTAAALAGFKEMVKVDVFVRPDMILGSDLSENGNGAGKVTIELNSRELCNVYR